MAGTSSASDTTGETQWWKWWIRFVVIPILVVTITAFVSFRAGSQRQIAIKGTTSNFDSGGWGTLYFDDESLKGIAQWVQTTSLKPGASPEDHFKLARAYHQLGDFGNAASEYLKAQGVPESKYLHARTLLSLRKPSEAQTVLESVLKSDLDVKVTYYLGVCLMQEHKYEPARQCFQSIVSQRPEALGAWHNIGMCNLHLKDYESAIYALNIVNERNPVFARAAFQKGVALYHLGKKRDALGPISDGVHLDPRLAKELESSDHKEMQDDSDIGAAIRDLISSQYAP